MNDQNSNLEKDENQLPTMSVASNNTIQEETTTELSSLSIAGLIIQIVGAAIVLFFAFFGINLTVGIITLIGVIITLVFTILALKNKTHGMVLTAGILGIFFTGIIGGILTLVGNSNVK